MTFCLFFSSSFTELTEFAFTIPDVEVFLSEKHSRDLLEQFQSLSVCEVSYYLLGCLRY